MPLLDSSGIFGVLFSVFVVVIAALNLVLDFDFIEQGAEKARRNTWNGMRRSASWLPLFGFIRSLAALGKLQDRR